MKNKSWDLHYTRDKSFLLYPDENLVRLIKKNIPTENIINPDFNSIDIGSGSGRHLKLLKNLDVKNIIGLDISLEGLQLSKKHLPLPYIQNDIKNLSFKDNSFDLIIAWGALHYDYKNNLIIMLNEIKRILKPGGFLFATLRSARDKYLKKGNHLGNDQWQTDLNDLDGSIVSFFTEDELKNHFKIFPNFEYGLLERSIIGDTSKIISHWVISASC
jgi:SAM-dependent methyltransferase